MRHIQELMRFRITDRPVVFSLGSFDGVHRGHQHLLSQGRQIADERGALFAVLSFSSPPRSLFHPNMPLLLLASTSHRHRLLEAMGVDIFIEVPFSKELREMSATHFLENLSRMMCLHTWVGGRDLHFGYHGEGTWHFLEQYAAQSGIRTVFIDRINVDGQQISSSRIRSLVLSGAFTGAATLLGRPFSIFAKAFPSRSHRRRVTTTNLCLPPVGRYAAKVRRDNSSSWTDSVLFVPQANGVADFCEVAVNEDIERGEFLEVIPLHPA